MARLKPLPIDCVPELQQLFAERMATTHFVPNSLLILQRRPNIVKAFTQLVAAVFEGEIDLGLKRLLAYVVSRTHGCHY